MSARKLGSLQRQQAVLTAEPSLQPQELIVLLKRYVDHLRKILEIVSVYSEFRNLLYRTPYCNSLAHTMFFFSPAHCVIYIRAT